MKPTEGSIEIKGNIVPMLELGSGFDMELSGRENIFLNGAILGYTEKFLKRKYNEIVEFSELGEFIEAPIRTYSSGMLARLAFSVACVVEPEILIVDEILSVGDADFQEKSRKRMMELMTGGTTVFFVSHSIKQIKENGTKDYGGIIIDSKGRTVTVDGKQIEMSLREYELLKYLVDNKGIALSRDKILNNVWNYDYYGDSRTIDSHIKKIRHKLGKKRRTNTKG